MPAASSLGLLLREWRGRRRLSQLDLALAVGVSARHLSFIETGRSQPSPEVVIALAEGLDVPLRERNTMLLAAGYAPRYSERSLTDPATEAARRAIQQMLDAHDPYPGVVVDRRWDVTLSNQSAAALLVGLPDTLTHPAVNVYRLCLHPDGLARRTLNLEEWAYHLLNQLRRSVAVTGEPGLVDLLDEISTYPSVVGLPRRRTPPDEAPLLVPFRVEANGRELAYFTTLTTFGTPQDVTLDELMIELFFPADAETAAYLGRGSVPRRGLVKGGGMPLAPESSR